MKELSEALLLLGLLLGSSYLGMSCHRWLREHHRSGESLDSARLVINILVPFAALVLGLLVTSVKANFDAEDDALRQLGTRLIELDSRLREYGPQAEPIRAMVRQYTGAAISTTWPNEPAPGGNYETNRTQVIPDSLETMQLTDLLMQIDSRIQQLTPANGYQMNIAPIVRAAMQATLQARWKLIAGAAPTVSWPFLLLLTFWLIIIFTVFGLTSPRNGMIHAVIVLAAISVASSIYLILDLDTPFGGFIAVSSQPMRDALRHLDRPVQQQPLG